MTLVEILHPSCALFLDFDGTMVDLNTLVAPIDDWRLVSASDVSRSARVRGLMSSSRMFSGSRIGNGSTKCLK